ncbi:MAG: nucleotidyltransferase [Desulfurococcus sp.]|jgi:predicted nucleotidyltransferase|uniref:nucleotidyltransferase n=3 Tax=Desulfurococcus sp. TaxID=51678 RepID=UPI003168EDE4
MAYSIEELAGIMKTLQDEGVKAVIIGDTVVQLALGRRRLEGDVDLFVYEPSPLLEQDYYHELASRHGWEASSTEVGTVKLVAPLSEDYLEIELYENYMDIEIPDEILEKADVIRMGGVIINVLPVEAYLVLKARQGVDADRLAEYVKQLKNSINIKLVEELIGYYHEEEQETIMNRLRDAGLNI